MEDKINETQQHTELFGRFTDFGLELRSRCHHFQGSSSLSTILHVAHSHAIYCKKNATICCLECVFS